MEMSIYMILLCAVLRGQISKASFNCPPSAPTLAYVDSCPKNKTEWDHAAERKKCYMMATHQNCTDAAKFQYHCLLNHHRNATLEVCAPIFYLQGFCASYNTDKIDIVENYEPGFECLEFPEAADRCPSRYPSSESYKYLPCYGSQIGAKTTISMTTKKTATTVTTTNDEGNAAYILVIVTLAIIVVALICSFILINTLKRKFGRPNSDVENQKNEGGENEDPEQKSLLKDDESQKIKEESQKKKEDEKKISKLKDLLKYPIHILKRELDVRDLKEKIVIYSKSIKAHLTVTLISSLQSVQSSDDYSRLDMTVVFTLLQSFCENIKTPSKGWDNEPPSDEMTTGADIERIRLMWNKFCDGDLQFPQLDDVYKRMKNKFGTVAAHGDGGERKSPDKDEEGFEDIRDKISCIKLNPDCVIEKGIIITDNITSAIRHLQTRNVVILKGAIGCGKTHALKAIKNHFEEKEWNTELMDENLRLEDLKTDNGKTVLLCDNFGGRFGYHYYFTKGFIEKFEEILGNLDSGSTGNTKVVIGIHQHVFEEVTKTHSLNFLQNKNSTIELDKLTEAETWMIFKEQQKEGHCKADSGCWFRKIEFSSVLSKLSTSPGHIGSPFLSLIYCHHHNLFSDDDFVKYPVQCLIKHFKGMREMHLTVYFSLVYVMCVQTHSLDTEIMSWAGFIDAHISNKAIEDTIQQNPGYFHTEKRKTTLMHDILTIALFKCAAVDLGLSFRPVIQHCGTDILLELLRPGMKTECEFYTCLQRKRDKKSVIHKIGQQWEQMKHPLLSDRFFEYRYEKKYKNRLNGNKET